MMLACEKVTLRHNYNEKIICIASVHRLTADLYI